MTRCVVENISGDVLLSNLNLMSGKRREYNATETYIQDHFLKQYFMVYP